MSQQLTMFEPQGSELAALGAQAIKAALGFERLADVFEMRGFDSLALSMRLNQAERQQFAQACDSALAFELISGLTQ